MWRGGAGVSVSWRARNDVIDTNQAVYAEPREGQESEGGPGGRSRGQNRARAPRSRHRGVPEELRPFARAEPAERAITVELPGRDADRKGDVVGAFVVAEREVGDPVVQEVLPHESRVRRFAVPEVVALEPFGPPFLVEPVVEI